MTRNREREEMVVRAVRLGQSGADVGRSLGISRERVRQIWKRATGTDIPVRPPMQPLDPASRLARRRWSLVHIESTGCWSWSGSHYPAGYANIGPPWGYAHRWTYEQFKGPIPTGLTIDHLCRNRGCVNPDHLEAVTQRENTLRSPIAIAAINARKTHCKHGHEFTSENTRRDILPNGRIGRSCRTCERRRAHEQYLRKKAVA